MNLQQYYIPFADHVSEPATEGFFMDDKNPQTTSHDEFGTGVWETIKYKKVSMRIPGPNWSKVFVGSMKHTTKTFKTKGMSILSTYIKELSNAEQFVKSNGDKFRAAVASGNTEVMNNLADGLRNCFPELIAANRATQKNINQFGGDIIEADDAFKAKLISILEPFQNIYRNAGALCAKHYIEEHESKSTLKKVFKHTLKGYHENNYLEKELYAYCKDIHYHIQDAYVD